MVLFISFNIFFFACVVGMEQGFPLAVFFSDWPRYVFSFFPRSKCTKRA